MVRPTQYQSYLDFATNAPGYDQIQPEKVLAQLNASYFDPAGCKEQEEACYAAGTNAQLNEICKKSDDFCTVNIYFPAVEIRNPYDLRKNASTVFPPEYCVDFLQMAAKIGAETRCHKCADTPYNKLEGGWMLLPQFGALVNSGLKIWAGDTDIM